jgi:hypothetical protein
MTESREDNSVRSLVSIPISLSPQQWELLCALIKQSNNRVFITAFGGVRNHLETAIMLPDKKHHWKRKRKTTRRNHGYSNTSTYRIWSNMRSRCEKLKDASYEHYGGRGIKVCQRWSSFSNFVLDMGVRPDGMTLERINNSGNYEPSNCKWASMQENSNNTRRNRILAHKGRQQTMAQWARELGINYDTFKSKIERGSTILEITRWHAKRK